MPRIKLKEISVPAVIVALAAVASLVTPWSISIPPAHLDENFGFQTPACWLAVFGMGAAVMLETRFTAVAAGIAAAAVAGWFAWAVWIVSTPTFQDLPFPFMATDVIGSGWYLALWGLLFAAGIVVQSLVNSNAALGRELWAFTALPGYGLMRLGNWWRGLAFTIAVSGAFYLASTDSPDPTQFVVYGRENNVPPSYPRGAEWLLLGIAVVLWIASIGMTIVEKRRTEA